MQSFVYVASGEPHKNHRPLIEAWCLLAKEGLFPSLCLTLDETRFARLYKDIDELRQRYDLKVTNAAELSHKDVLALYKKADALIYPSTFESFGLPLIEARQAGLPVLAAELDYVRDVIDPEQTFDPESPISIARAVKRFIKSDEPALPLLDAKKFLEQVVGKAK
jgi:glycosyltransferase involved in cell wall biosynthesis